MNEVSNRMNKFEFLLGDWNLEYKIPKSDFSDATTGSGSGSFKKALDENYVFFDYTALINKERGQAHGIFVWDSKSELYRFWWFESSGSFMQATCQFVSDKKLCLNWHNSVLVQSFEKISENKVVLRMEQQSEKGFNLILEVIFTKKYL